MKMYVHSFILAVIYSMVGYCFYLNGISYLIAYSDMIITDLREDMIMLFKTSGYFSLMGILVYLGCVFFSKRDTLESKQRVLLYAGSVFINGLSFLIFVLMYRIFIHWNDSLMIIDSVPVAIDRSNINLSPLILCSTLITLLISYMLSRCLKNQKRIE